MRPELLCILYADLVDFTAQGLAAFRLGTEALLTEQKQRFLILWSDATIAKGGAVANTMGDAILATFPSAPAALRAAVLAYRALQTDPLSKTQLFRVGMHVGTANVLPDGNIDGLAVDVVSRIANVAGSGQIVASAAAIEQLRFCRDEFAWIDLGEHTLKGLDPLRLYSVTPLGWPQVPNSLLSKPRGIPTTPDRFIGREQERAESWCGSS